MLGRSKCPNILKGHVVLYNVHAQSQLNLRYKFLPSETLIN